MDNMLPKSTLVEVGDTVYLKDSMPVSREYKVVAVLMSTQLPYKDFVWVEDKETKERHCVLAEWLSHEAFTEQWREESEPAETSYRSIENVDTGEIEVKDKSTLSAEINEGKLPNEILASNLESLTDDEEELLRFNLASWMTNETGEEDFVVEEFVDHINLGKSEDGKYWGYLGSRRIAVVVDDNWDVENVTYFIKASAIQPKEFFGGLEQTAGIIITAYKDDEYVLNLGGDEYYMTNDDLNDFCNDWDLDFSQVRGSLTKTGKWSFGQGQ